MEVILVFIEQPTKTSLKRKKTSVVHWEFTQYFMTEDIKCFLRISYCSANDKTETRRSLSKLTIFKLELRSVSKHFIALSSSLPGVQRFPYLTGRWNIRIE